MKKEVYTIAINAPREKVWNVLWGDTYDDWTSVFSEGSTVKTDWKEGSKVLFLNKDNEGMVSRIAKKTPNEFMSFQHIGMVDKGVETIDETHDWYNALENYTLEDKDGGTFLRVDMHITEEYLDYFADVWPKALNKVKELSEN